VKSVDFKLAQIFIGIEYLLNHASHQTGAESSIAPSISSQANLTDTVNIVNFQFVTLK
jgi:hypothetical protein